MHELLGSIQDQPTGGPQEERRGIQSMLPQLREVDPMEEEASLVAPAVPAASYSIQASEGSKWTRGTAQELMGHDLETQQARKTQPTPQAESGTAREPAVLFMEVVGCDGSEEQAQEGMENGPENQHKVTQVQEVLPDEEQGKEVGAEEQTQCNNIGKNQAQEEMEQQMQEREGQGVQAMQDISTPLKAFTEGITKKVQSPVLKLQQKVQKKAKKGPALEKKPVTDTIETPRRSTRVAKKLQSGKTIEAQAVELIMKKCGTWEGDKDNSSMATEKMAKKFAQPITTEVVKELRELFGMNSTGQDFHSALAVHADEA